MRGGGGAKRRVTAPISYINKNLPLVASLVALPIIVAPNGTPSSYCWMNMVVYYLQVVGLLPSLQNANTYNMEKAEMINGLNVNFATAEEARKTFVQTEDEGLWTLGRLAAGFFKYYSQAFDLHTGVVSIRLPMGKAVRGSAGEGGLLTGKSLKKGQFAKTKPWRICVEDPFECLGSVFVHDLGMVVGEIGAEVMVRALEDATEILEGGAGGWGELFEVRGWRGARRLERSNGFFYVQLTSFYLASLIAELCCFVYGKEYS